MIAPIGRHFIEQIFSVVSALKKGILGKGVCLSGNLFQFFFLVHRSLHGQLKVPFLLHVIEIVLLFINVRRLTLIVPVAVLPE